MKRGGGLPQVPLHSPQAKPRLRRPVVQRGKLGVRFPGASTQRLRPGTGGHVGAAAGCVQLLSQEAGL